MNFILGLALVLPAFATLSRPDIKARLERAQKAHPPPDNGSTMNAQKDPVEALVSAEPSAIPEVPGTFKPFPRRDVPPEENELRQRALNQLWGTPLGQMLRFYLLNGDGPEAQPAYSREFAKRIYSDANQGLTRLEAFYLLVNDLIAKKKMSVDMERRLIILRNDLQQTNEAGAAKTKSSIIMQSIVFLFCAIPLGFPAFRARAQRAFQALKRRFKAGPPPKPVKKEGAWYAFEPLEVLNRFIQIFGAYNLFYFMYYDWTSALFGQQVHDTVLLNGLDDLIKLLQS